ncbi:MAG: hypothetical protein JRI68_31080 [Deltaproteobacteria bacterium]|nr:hypothetical protein [Deltaproteobacteria bacterium]
MIRFNSFLHRLELADIIGRWMVDQLQPTDVRQLKELISFNGHLSRIVLDEVATGVFGQLLGREVESLPVSRKGVLKDFLADHPPYTNPRIRQMVTRYRRYPQDFYRETPFDGRVYFDPNGGQRRIVGSTRRKRFKRIAEKSSRRIVDHIFKRIKDEANLLAQERAEQLGVPLDRLVTPEHLQVEEFAHAERRIVKSLRTGTFLTDMPLLDINDVFLEYELHSGNYNALNITLSYRIDKDRLAAQAPAGSTLETFANRGLSPPDVSENYQRFIREGEDELVIELIITNYQEGLESEIGRAMHEERILAQRDDQQYRGSLARNIAALLEYMLVLRRHPSDHIDELPIKLWIKYMPDYFESVMKEAYGETDTVFLGY